MSDTEDFLEADNPIPGQSYVCLSFISPDEIMKNKELYLFNRYMTQKCGEWENDMDDILKKCGSEVSTKLEKEFKSKLKIQLKYTYEQFKSNFDDFKYKYSDNLDKDFNEISDYKTSMRGVKIRGVYETLKETEIRAKQLQKRDRSFHVFVGSVGKWLPWDPCADKVQNEEYLESELNTLMQEYKKNEVNKDMFYEDQKRDKKETALKEKIESDKEREKQEEENKKNMQNIEENLETEDPWLSRQKSISGEKLEESNSVEPTVSENTKEETMEEVN
jgi:hypothetical protein